eukprot:COSAG06_NODE_6920_length_2715_cov_39.300640_3_plen_44_part_01
MLGLPASCDVCVREGVAQLCGRADEADSAYRSQGIHSKPSMNRE